MYGCQGVIAVRFELWYMQLFIIHPFLLCCKNNPTTRNMLGIATKKQSRWQEIKRYMACAKHVKHQIAWLSMLDLHSIYAKSN